MENPFVDEPQSIFLTESLWYRTCPTKIYTKYNSSILSAEASLKARNRYNTNNFPCLYASSCGTLSYLETEESSGIFYKFDDDSSLTVKIKISNMLILDLTTEQNLQLLRGTRDDLISDDYTLTQSVGTYCFFNTKIDGIIYPSAKTKFFSQEFPRERTKNLALFFNATNPSQPRNQSVKLEIADSNNFVKNYEPFNSQN